ncbi:MAG TPA: serine hydrolase domain-containing protein [Candidatus Polarisedimenticolia bacterium]|nr:serine hydrolase domain-containing protein [Candidatus Polarisedimenticolia bacterium]
MKPNNDRLSRLLRSNWIHLAILIVLCSGFCEAQSGKLSSGKLAKIDAAVSRFMASTHVPGMSVAVVENGEYEWAQGFGFADLENNVPASEHTLFRLASISKSLTATAAMQLWDRGRLDLDAPVQKYCPSFPQKTSPISIRQVLGHLGGIRHYKSLSQDDPEVGNTKHFDDPVQAGLDFFKDDPLVAQPGTSFRYSTQGYTLIGCVIEGASGAKYVDFVHQNVLVPAQMERTQADNRFAIIPYRTRFYEKTESGTVRNSDFLDSSYKIPGGGWLSSAEDMARFEVAILNDKLIRRTTRDLMWTPLKPSDGLTDAYGLGWRWGDENDHEVASVGNLGGQQGTSTAFRMVPERRVGVVVLTNMQGQPADDLAREILKILVAAPESKS